MNPRIPKSEKYWKNKGKVGKKVMLYFHDDLDGIFSALIMKKYLLNKSFEIVGYGIINYQDSWRYTTLHEKYINIVVDFSEMPTELKRHKLIDVYIDHHGSYNAEERDYYKNMPVIKTPTDSAFEGICYQLGMPVDSLTLDPIDMVDSAKYSDYGVRWEDILELNFAKIKHLTKKDPKNAKLTFTGAFNQIIKRGDYTSLIEVVENLNEPSIYAVYNYLTRLYPGNNKDKEFHTDGNNRISQFIKRSQRSITSNQAKIYWDQYDFRNEYQINKSGYQYIKATGYQIIGHLAFFPAGNWANAVRARAFIRKEYNNGNIPHNHKINFIMIQHGATIQVCGYEKMDKMGNLPILKSGYEVTNLSDYMNYILTKSKQVYGYINKHSNTMNDEVTTKAGGHVGIGTISNITGKVNWEKVRKGIVNGYIKPTTDREKLRIMFEKKNYQLIRYVHPYTKKNMVISDGVKYIDIFKNKIIKDLSGANWNDLNMIMSSNNKSQPKKIEIDKMVLMVEDIRHINNLGEII